MKAAVDGALCRFKKGDFLPGYAVGTLRKAISEVTRKESRAPSEPRESLFVINNLVFRILISRNYCERDQWSMLVTGVTSSYLHHVTK
jgi:hypothetical protein